MINVMTKGKNEKEYFVLINTRQNGLEVAYLTRDEVIEKTADLFDLNYVYTRNRTGMLRQVVDIVLLDENNEGVSTTSLVTECASDGEYQAEVDRLLEMAEVE